MTTSTNHKGHVAELAVAHDLAARYGYTVSFPIKPVAYDLIADRETETMRVQVKSVRRRIRGENEYAVIDCTNGSGRRYARGAVDLFAGYDAMTGRIYYVSAKDVASRREIWIEPSKVYQL